MPRIARWGRSETDTSIVKWRRALVVLASSGGMVWRSSPGWSTPAQDVLGQSRALATKALHRDSIQYRRHNACEASCAKMAVTGLARR